jgi:hypothetical protein
MLDKTITRGEAMKKYFLITVAIFFISIVRVYANDWDFVCEKGTEVKVEE